MVVAKLVHGKHASFVSDTEQAWKPSSEEKIELAKIGLGLSEALFNVDGDAEHIHKMIVEKFPVLESCGGCTFLRLVENSHNMVEIEGPDSGILIVPNVPSMFSPFQTHPKHVGSPKLPLDMVPLEIL